MQYWKDRAMSELSEAICNFRGKLHNLEDDRRWRKESESADQFCNLAREMLSKLESVEFRERNMTNDVILKGDTDARTKKQ